MAEHEQNIRIWTQNNEAVEEAILAGEETESVLTEYGANEFAVDFLMQNKIWPQLLVKPAGWNNNGIDWQKLGGIAILNELLHVGHLAKADKVIKDAKLMRELGFTFSETQEAKADGKGVIHRDSVRNYFKRIPTEQSKKEFYGFVNFMRQKRWVRGRTYVADGLEIEVCGKTYEGIGKVWDDKKKKWKYGYKAVLLMNVEEERERIMGFAIGPINSDERELLLTIFDDLEKHVGKIKEIMDEIIIDRGYWGYEFLEETLVKKYGIDYVIIAKKNFLFVKEDLRHMIDSRQIEWQERQLYNRTKKENETVKVAFVKDLMHGYKNKEQPYQGLVNVVAMKYMEGKEEKEVFYVTNKKVPKNPLKIVQLYGSRWTIENQGNRDLSQRWLIRILAGRSLNAITARICLIFKLYNSMKVMEMKHGEEWQENKELIESWGERSFIAGHGLIVYCEKHFATLCPNHYKKLIEKSMKQKFKDVLKGYLPLDKAEELLKKLNR